MSASILFLMKTTQGQSKRANESYKEAGSIVLMAASAIRTVYSLNASSLFIDKYGESIERAYRSAASRVALLGESSYGVLGNGMYYLLRVSDISFSHLLVMQF